MYFIKVYGKNFRMCHSGEGAIFFHLMFYFSITELFIFFFIFFPFSVIVSISIFALLWLTLDSIREACGSKELTLTDNEAGREFCADITKLFTNRKAPDSWVQFVRNFVETFIIHWTQAVNKPLIKKFSFLFDSKQMDS